MPKNSFPPTALLWLPIVLGVMGYLGNYFKFSLFFGVDLIFGSIFAIVGVRILGIGKGTAIGFVAACCTYFLWGHPYAIVIFTCETLFIGLWCRFRNRKNVLIADGIYWLILGIPLVFLFYGKALGTSLTGVTLIALKQAVNGIVNALVADILVGFWPSPKQQPVVRRNFYQTILTLSVVCVFVPTLTLTLLYGKKTLAMMEATILKDLEQASVVHYKTLLNWYSPKLKVVTQAAEEMIAQEGDRDIWQEKLQARFPSFKNLYISVLPPLSIPHSNPESIPIIAPLGQKTLVAIFDAHFVEEEICSLTPGFQIFLYDRQKRLIASCPPNTPPFLATGTTYRLHGDLYQWLPTIPGKTLTERWRRSYYVQEMFLTFVGWTLELRDPTAPYFAVLEQLHIEAMVVVLSIFLITVLTTELLSYRLTRPIEQLAILTAELPQHLNQAEELYSQHLPTSHIQELDRLSENFGAMSHLLAQKFQELQQSNATLEERDRERQKQAEADRLLIEVSTAINTSFSLSEVLTNSLAKIRTFLVTERVLVYQVLPEGKGVVAYESVAYPEISLAQRMFHDPCFTGDVVQKYLNSGFFSAQCPQDIPEASCYGTMLANLHVKSYLVLPILLSSNLWGLFIIHSFAESRQWSAIEVSILRQIAIQIGTAVQKSTLQETMAGELRQKEYLLKEIHHRVKNNLQIVSSLLRIQFRNVDGELATSIQEYQNRILSMAMIHEQLYSSNNFECIDFEKYIVQLSNNLFTAYSIQPGCVQLLLETHGIDISLERAIPLGLILNELLSNSLKYAFPNGEGTIAVKMAMGENQLWLSVSDNGQGLPESMNIFDSPTLGMRLILSLTKQLQGTVQVFRDRGTRFEFVF